MRHQRPLILRVYRMSEAENAEDIEHDRQMVNAGVMSEREFWKRSSTREVARNIRRRDNGGRWPRDDARLNIAAVRMSSAWTGGRC